VFFSHEGLTVEVDFEETREELDKENNAYDAEGVSDTVADTDARGLARQVFKDFRGSGESRCTGASTSEDTRRDATRDVKEFATADRADGRTGDNEDG
jgi:TATA-box binding protein (TBP) (component of TFIID and TFIIIB)